MLEHTLPFSNTGPKVARVSCPLPIHSPRISMRPRLSQLGASYLEPKTPETMENRRLAEEWGSDGWKTPKMVTGVDWSCKRSALYY